MVSLPVKARPWVWVGVSLTTCSGDTCWSSLAGVVDGAAVVGGAVTVVGATFDDGVVVGGAVVGGAVVGGAVVGGAVVGGAVVVVVQTELSSATCWPSTHGTWP